MHTLDLAELDGTSGARQRLAARFDQAMRLSGHVLLENHDLDMELLELAGTFGRQLLAHAELREVFAEHRVAMLGVAQRVLALAGIALGHGSGHFSDRLTGAPRVEFTLEEGGRGASPIRHLRGLLGVRQDVLGRVVAWVGPQFPSLVGVGYRVPPAPELPRIAPALRLDLASAVSRASPRERLQSARHPMALRSAPSETGTASL